MNGDMQGVKRNRWYSLAAKTWSLEAFCFFALLFCVRDGEEELNHYWLLATEMGGSNCYPLLFAFFSSNCTMNHRLAT
jgi:hypothetical protein